MYQLRPYQQSAVDACLHHFRRQSTPAVIVLPTGAGKSLVIAELARIAKGRVLVLAHVRELVEQNHAKYESYGLKAGIFSAGLNRKDSGDKVIFGNVQSVARAGADFFKSFSLLVIDECHRVSDEGDTQYFQVISKLREDYPQIRILGLTATPYRLGLGWIYEYSHRGVLRSTEQRFFKKCIYELSLGYMVDHGYLSMPVKIDSPVANYDFSKLMERGRRGGFKTAEVEEILKDQGRVTPGIVENIVEIAKDRQGVMIFAASVRHAREILGYLPSGRSEIVVGETEDAERDAIISRFKKREIKFLVNVSVLTTGFDAPHVDLIAILRPTESVSLFQQIAGRGLRLSPGKTDCLILDYTGMPHDIFSPEIGDDRPDDESVPVEVVCPACGFTNDFWGIKDADGEVIEHYGRKCRGVSEDPRTFALKPCGFRFRFKNCDRCGAENDIAARSCGSCENVLVDADRRLRDAMALKDAHILRPDSMVFEKTVDKKGNERLEVRYYDPDAKYLTEYFYLKSSSDSKAFYYNFIRMHNRLPEKKIFISSVDEALRHRDRFRMPMFVIARKEKHYWKVREKVFAD